MTSHAAWRDVLFHDRFLAQEKTARLQENGQLFNGLYLCTVIGSEAGVKAFFY